MCARVCVCMCVCVCGGWGTGESTTRCTNTACIHIKKPQHLCSRRLRMGVCEGVPRAIVPDHLGRADYYGECINSAARYMSGAAHGGQIVLQEKLGSRVVAGWKRPPQSGRHSMHSMRSGEGPSSSAGSAGAPGAAPHSPPPRTAYARAVSLSFLLTGDMMPPRMRTSNAGSSSGRLSPAQLRSRSNSRTYTTMRRASHEIERATAAPQHFSTPCPASPLAGVYAALQPPSLASGAHTTSQGHWQQQQPQQQPQQQQSQGQPRGGGISFRLPPPSPPCELSQTNKQAPPRPSSLWSRLASSLHSPPSIPPLRAATHVQQGQPESPTPSPLRASPYLLQTPASADEGARLSAQGTGLYSPTSTTSPTSGPRTLETTHEAEGEGEGGGVPEAMPTLNTPTAASAAAGVAHEKAASPAGRDSAAGLSAQHTARFTGPSCCFTSVSVVRIGKFKFKGASQELSMAHVCTGPLMGRASFWPSEAPAGGKSQKLAEASGVVVAADRVELPPVARQYQEAWEAKQLHSAAAAPPGNPD